MQGYEDKASHDIYYLLNKGAGECPRRIKLSVEVCFLYFHNCEGL